MGAGRLRRLGSSESIPAVGGRAADLRKRKLGGANGIQISEHWAQSGFANTDLDFQLKQHGVTHVVTVGLLANTCIESTSRFAMELGYHVTLVRDATAAFSHEFMDAAHDLNGPTFAHAILTTPELLAALPPAAG
jgi:nicotinamidase-related amidase